MANARFTLFNQNFEKMRPNEIMDGAKQIGDLILRGNTRDREKTVAMVTAKPMLMYSTVVAGDSLGTPVEGKLLQIAAMAGNVKLAMELAKAAKLPNEEIENQLLVITSKEAQRENAARNKRYLRIMKKFGTSISRINHSGTDCDSFQKKCKFHIDLLVKELQSERNKKVALGYIFDLDILNNAWLWWKTLNPYLNNTPDWLDEKTSVFIDGIQELHNIMCSYDEKRMKNRIKDDVELTEFYVHSTTKPIVKSIQLRNMYLKTLLEDSKASRFTCYSSSFNSCVTM
jgi:hypothetical protein